MPSSRQNRRRRRVWLFTRVVVVALLHVGVGTTCGRFWSVFDRSSYWGDVHIQHIAWGYAWEMVLSWVVLFVPFVVPYVNSLLVAFFLVRFHDKLVNGSQVRRTAAFLLRSLVPAAIVFLYLAKVLIAGCWGGFGAAPPPDPQPTIESIIAQLSLPGRVIAEPMINTLLAGGEFGSLLLYCVAWGIALTAMARLLSPASAKIRAATGRTRVPEEHQECSS